MKLAVSFESMTIQSIDNSSNHWASEPQFSLLIACSYELTVWSFNLRFEENKEKQPVTSTAIKTNLRSLVNIDSMSHCLHRDEGGSANNDLYMYCTCTAIFASIIFLTQFMSFSVK